MLPLGFITLFPLLLSPGSARVLDHASQYELLFPRENNDACFVPCGPNSCTADQCNVNVRRSTTDVTTFQSFNLTAEVSSYHHDDALTRRDFMDSIYDLQVTTYVEEQAAKIPPKYDIKPDVSSGISKPSYCLQKKFDDLPRDQGQQIFGIPKTKRTRGCTVITIISARAFYMCHLYGTYHFEKYKDEPFVDIQPVQNLIQKLAGTSYVAGDSLDTSLYNQESDGTTMFIMSPTPDKDSDSKTTLKYQTQVDKLVKTVKDIIPAMNAIEFPYRPVPNDENVQYSWQGLALLEWDPDFTGQGVGIGTAQWRLWYQNAYITGLVNDGLTHCLSTDRDDASGDNDNAVTQIVEIAGNLAITDDDGDTSCTPGAAPISKRSHDYVPGDDANRTIFNSHHEVETLFKRANKRKRLTWDKQNDLDFGLYPPCRDAINIAEIDKYWTFEAKTDPPHSCPTRMRHIISGMLGAKAPFNSEHILEAQMFTAFLKFVCGDDMSVSMPKGYSSSKRDWVTGVLLGLPNAAKLDAFSFTSASVKYASLLGGFGAALGGSTTPERLVLTDSNVNIHKGTWFAGKKPDPTPSSRNKDKKADKVDLRVMKFKQRNIVGAIQFMQQKPIWTKLRSSLGMVETVLRDFDQSYQWGKDKKNVELQRPARAANEPPAGLRDLWCWWIDNWFLNIEQRTAAFPSRAEDAMRKFKPAYESDGTTLKIEAKDWIDKFLKGATAPAQHMTLPRPNSGYQAAVKGQVNHGSPFGAWNVEGKEDLAWFGGPW